MFTKDELAQLGELLKPIHEKLDNVATKEDVRAIVKEELGANNTVIGTIVRVEIAAANQKLGKKIDKRLNAQDERIEEIKTGSHISKN